MKISFSILLFFFLRLLSSIRKIWKISPVYCCWIAFGTNVAVAEGGRSGDLCVRLNHQICPGIGNMKSERRAIQEQLQLAVKYSK